MTPSARPATRHAPRWIGLLIALATTPGWRPATAWAESRPGYGGSASVGSLGRPATFDPVRARSYAEVTVAGLVFDTLYRLDSEGRAVPHLAVDPPTPTRVGDPTTVRIELIAGLTFSDSRPLTAMDVVGSLERSRRSEGVLSAIAAVGVEGDAVVIALTRPCPELAALLASPTTAVTPAGAAPAWPPIGSGPFVLNAVDDAAGAIRLVANPAHFAGRPYLDLLTLRWFTTPDGEPRSYEAGQLDVSLRGALAFAGHQPRYPTAVASSTPSILVFVGFGRAHRGAWSDVSLRRALHLALDRQSLTALGTGEKVIPTVEPTIKAQGARPVRPTELLPDPRAAATALGQAVRTLGPLGAERFEVLVDATRPDDRQVGEKVALALFHLGLSAAIRAVAPAELAERARAGTCDLFIGQLAMSTEPSATWQLAFAAGQGGAATDLIAAESLFAIRARLESRFRATLPIVPLFHRGVRLHHRTDLRRPKFDSIGRIDLADMFHAPVTR